MAEQSEKIIIYAHPACPQVYPVQGMLNQADADYEYINIFDDTEARQRVREINNGYESVPTIVFPDGSTLTEPDAAALREKLREMGYDVPFTAMVVGNAWKLIILAGMVIALLRLLGVF